MFRTERMNQIHQLFLPSTVPSNTSLGRYQSHYAVAHALKLNEVDWAKAFLMNVENLLHRSDVLRRADALELLLMDFEAVWQKLKRSDTSFGDWTQCIRNAVPIVSAFWPHHKTVLDAWIQILTREGADNAFREAVRQHLGQEFDVRIHRAPQSLHPIARSVGISVHGHKYAIYGGCFVTERLFLSWAVDGTFSIVDVINGTIAMSGQMDDSLTIEHCEVIGQYAFLATHQQVVRLDIDSLEVQGVISARFTNSNGQIQEMHQYQDELYVLVSKGLLVLNPTTCKPVQHMLFKMTDDPMYLSVRGFRRMCVLSDEQIILAKRQEWLCINPIEKQVMYRPSIQNGQIQHVQAAFGDCVVIVTSKQISLYSQGTWELNASLDGEWSIATIDDFQKNLLLYNSHRLSLWKPISTDSESTNHTGDVDIEVQPADVSGPNSMRVMQALQDSFKKMGGLEDFIKSQLAGLTREEREILKEQIMQDFITMFDDLDAQKAVIEKTEEPDEVEEISAPSVSNPSFHLDMTLPISNTLGGAWMDDSYVVTWSMGRGTELLAMPQELLDNESLDEGSIFVISRSDGQFLHTLHGHTSTIMDVRPIQTDVWISASSDGSVALWDVRRGELLGKVQFHTGEIEQVAIQRERIVTMSNQGIINQIHTSEMVGHTSNIRSHTGEVKGVRVLNDTQVVSWGTDGDIWIWDWKLGRSVQQLSGHTYVVSDVLVESSSKIISIGLDNKIIEWSLVNGKWELIKQWSKESLPQEYSYVLTSNKPQPLRTEVGGVYKDEKHWLNSGRWKVWVEFDNHVVCSQGSQVQVVKFPV